MSKTFAYISFSSIFLLATNSQAMTADECKKELPAIANKKFHTDKSNGNREQYIVYAPVLSAIETGNLANRLGVKNGHIPTSAAYDKLAKKLLTDYVKLREEYNRISARENYYNYDLVRITSTISSFRAYQEEIILSNPASPGARLGKIGTRTVEVGEIKFVKTDTTPLRTDGPLDEYHIDMTITETKDNKIQSFKKSVIAAVGFENIDWNDEQEFGQCVNPLGFRVYSYTEEKK